MLAPEAHGELATVSLASSISAFVHTICKLIECNQPETVPYHFKLLRNMH